MRSTHPTVLKKTSHEQINHHIAILKLRSMNAKEIAMGMPSNALPDSRYRRVQRFFDQHWIDFDPKDKNGKGLNVIHHKVIYLAAKYVNESTPELYQDWLKMINESLTEKIDESNYPRPEMQKTIALIAKNLVTPEERYWMIEEYNFELAKKKEFEEGGYLKH